MLRRCFYIHLYMYLGLCWLLLIRLCFAVLRLHFPLSPFGLYFLCVTSSFCVGQWSRWRLRGRRVERSRAAGRYFSGGDDEALARWRESNVRNVPLYLPSSLIERIWGSCLADSGGRVTAIWRSEEKAKTKVAHGMAYARAGVYMFKHGGGAGGVRGSCSGDFGEN